MFFSFLKTKCDDLKINNFIVKFMQIFVSILLIYVVFYFIQKIPNKEFINFLKGFKDLFCIVFVICLFIAVTLMFISLFILNSVIISFLLPWSFNKFSKHMGGACKAILFVFKFFITINSIPFGLFIFCKYILKLDISFHYYSSLNVVFVISCIFFSFTKEPLEYVKYDIPIWKQIKKIIAF